MRNLTESELRILDTIIDDINTDVKSLDGKPFSGRTVGETFGGLLATMQALAMLIQAMNETRSFDDLNNLEGGG